MKVVVRWYGGSYIVAIADYTTLYADAVYVDGKAVELPNEGLLMVDALAVKAKGRSVEITTLAGQLENLAWEIFSEYVKLR